MFKYCWLFILVLGIFLIEMFLVFIILDYSGFVYFMKLKYVLFKIVFFCFIKIFNLLRKKLLKVNSG